MIPDWVQEVVLWTALVFSGYWIGFYRLEKKLKKQYDLRAEKLLRRIDQLKRERNKRPKGE